MKIYKQWNQEKDETMRVKDGQWKADSYRLYIKCC